MKANTELPQNRPYVQKVADRFEQPVWQQSQCNQKALPTSEMNRRKSVGTEMLSPIFSSRPISVYWNVLLQSRFGGQFSCRLPLFLAAQDFVSN